MSNNTALIYNLLNLQRSIYPGVNVKFFVTLIETTTETLKLSHEVYGEDGKVS